MSPFHGSPIDLYYFNDHIGLPFLIIVGLLLVLASFIEDVIRSRKEKL